MHGQDEPGLSADAPEEVAIDDRQHEPLQVHDIRPLSCRQPLERAHAGQVFEALQDLARRRGLPRVDGILGAPIEQRPEREPLLIHLLVGTQATADEHDLGARLRQRPAEAGVVGHA